MKILAAIFIGLTVTLTGCAGDPMFTTAVRLDDGAELPPTTQVQILETEPSRPYEKIALLETSMGVGARLTMLLESMRNKAAQLGADAIIPISVDVESTQPMLLYNPTLGGYQTIGGGNNPILRGYAIRYTDE